MGSITLATPPAAPGIGVGNLARHWAIVAQLVLATAVVYAFGIEGEPFLRIFALAAVAAAVNVTLPLNWRLPFFVGVSLAGVFLVFSPADGLWMVACGLVLIGASHLPVGFGARVGILVLLAAGLAVARAGQVNVPWSPLVWPILGSMFMFRLILYMMAVRAGQLGRAPVWGALAYFFMLPNLVFPLFPVVDYQTFRRTHYDRDEGSIYEQGMQWIARGLVHLLLYRVVYHQVLNDPVDVVHLGDLVQFMLGTFLLYLRVSGQFHLIVGILHLFGFRLPETHKLYYLAHSFTELWRRINIYWTDFMMKAVFYPVYFRVKQLGQARAVVVSTGMVFVTTWLLHSYQWFWLRNGFPLTPQDTAFWGILGVLVMTGAVREFKAAGAPRVRHTGWNWRMGLRATVTFMSFCFLWSLWSTESVTQWIYMLGAALEVDVKGIVLLTGTAGVLFVLGSRDWNAPVAAHRWNRPAVRTFATLVLLLAIAPAGLVRATSGPLSKSLAAMHTVGLNARDQAMNHRGYYEQLDVRGQVTDVVFDLVGMRSASWAPFSSTGVLRERYESLLVRDLNPSMSVTWNGQKLSTNRWGMRDGDYEREKSPNTLRIAMLGPSFMMGSGVSDGETFEAALEQQLNAERALGAYYDRVEVLNFAVEGHTFPEQLAMLEQRVLDFAPDIVIPTIYHPTRAWTERYVAKLVEYDVPVADPELQRLLETAGKGQTSGDIAVPYPFGRSLARFAGYHPRMPSAEAAVRIRRVTDDVVDWAIRRFARTTREHGIDCYVLALNAVIDEEPADIPHRRTFESEGLPLLDLFGIFPPDRRASLRVADYDEHPNAEGHQIIAGRLLEVLMPHLQARVDDRVRARAARRAAVSDPPALAGGR